MSHCCGGGLQEPDVEPGVVGDQHRAAGELEKHRQHRVDGRGVAHHRRGDAGQLDDLRRDAALRIDQGGELAEHHAAADLDRADLGDRVGGVPVGARRATAGGLQVDDDESGFAQRHSRRAADRGRRSSAASARGRAHGGDVKHAAPTRRGFAAARGQTAAAAVTNLSVPAVSVRQGRLSKTRGPSQMAQTANPNWRRQIRPSRRNRWSSTVTTARCAVPGAATVSSA